jgi:hypothetical protein
MSGFVIVSILLLVSSGIALADGSGNDTIVVPRIGDGNSTTVDVSEYYKPDYRTDRVSEAMNRLYIELAAKHYHDPMILNMQFHRDDRCEMNPNEAFMMCCFNASNPVSYNYAGPDQTFMGWHDVGINGFKANVRDIIEAGKEKPTVDKVAWTGNILSPNVIVMEHFTRPRLVEFTANYSNLFHFHHVSPWGQKITDDPHFMTQADMVRKFAYVLDIGGNGWSGRLKWLLFSHRPLFIVDRPFQDYFHRDLKPFVHFIPVKRDLSDLVAQTLWAKEHPEECRIIAENAFRFAAETFREQKLIERVYEVYKYIKVHHPDRFAHPFHGHAVRNGPANHPPPPPARPAPARPTEVTTYHPPPRPMSQNHPSHHIPLKAAKSPPRLTPRLAPRPAGH